MLRLIYRVDRELEIKADENRRAAIRRIDDTVPVIASRLKAFLAEEPQLTSVQDWWESLDDFTNIDSWLQAINIHFSTTNNAVLDNVARRITKDQAMTAANFVQTYSPIIRRLERELKT
jgi:hypothetical protein